MDCTSVVQFLVVTDYSSQVQIGSVVHQNCDQVGAINAFPWDKTKKGRSLPLSGASSAKLSFISAKILHKKSYNISC
jgi:hypothetical protein